MVFIEYYLKTDEKYHSEVYELIQILEYDQIDADREKEQDKAAERLEVLVELSKKK